MASFRVMDGATACVAHGHAFSEDVEDTDEVVIEINEFMPSEKSFLKDGSVIARLKDKNSVKGEMEEGELSGEEFHVENRRRILHDDGTSHMVNQRQPIQITIQNKEAVKLPDLLQEIGGHDVIGIDRNVTEKMEARAKRFNLSSAGSNIHYEDMMVLYKSLGISEAEIEGQIPKPDRQFRLEAIHIRGFDGSIVRSEDIHEYFSEFSPVSFEWVDKNSANVIWALPSSAAKALLTLSRPLMQGDNQALKGNSSQDGQSAVEDDDEMIDIRKADENAENEENESSNVEEESTRIKKQKMKNKILEKFSQSHTALVDVSEVGIDVPLYADVEQWRIGKPSDKLGVTIFMRIATRHDTGLDAGIGSGGDNSRLSLEELRQKNIKLKTTGGIISNSRKRKMQEVMLAAEEHEATKKYTGPVGKNPWGNIAEDWATYGKQGEKDFAEELGELANLVSGKKKPISTRIGTEDKSIDESEKSTVLAMDRSRDDSSLKKFPIITRRTPQTFTDWDAPENDGGVVVTSFRLDNSDPHVRKRKRNDSNEDTLEEHTEKDQDLKWSKRLKRPRMHMVADEIESKLSAKTRLYKGIQRRIDRPDLRKGIDRDRIEIFVEEEDENECSHKNDASRRKSEPTIDKKETLTMSVKINSSERRNDFSGVRMSERFPVRKGISASLRERLGDLGNKPAMSPPRKENDNRRTSENERNKTKDVSNKRLSGARGYHSGDSLEMDQGDDLRGELDGQHAANMVIQVTQSPKRHEERNQIEEDSGSDEDMEDDRRQESHIASVVAKIKQEKSTERVNIKEEPKDKDHRDQYIRSRDERRDKDRLRHEKEREKDEHRKREQANREKEIFEREKLRRERHRQIDERKSQQSRERKEEPASDRATKHDSRENRKDTHPKDDSTEKGKRKRDNPLRIKKEKLSDDERKRKGLQGESSSSDDSSASSSSTSTDESSSSGSSSESESDSSETQDSSSSSSDSSSEDELNSKRHDGPMRKKQKMATKGSRTKSSTTGKSTIRSSKESNKKRTEEKKITKTSKDALKARQKTERKNTEDIPKNELRRKDASESKIGGDNTGLRDKLKDYLKKAKERRKKEKGDNKD